MKETKLRNHFIFLFSKNFVHNFFISLTTVMILFCFAIFFIFLMGNFQKFQDKTLLILLTTLSYSSILTILLSILLFVETVRKIFTENRKMKFIITLLFLLLTIIFCLFFLIFATILGVFSKGII